jgi:polyhydroxyalkanoate synthase
MCRTGAEAVNLLICEGGTFTLAYAALEPARVRNLVLTVTPLDFHADQAEEKSSMAFSISGPAASRQRMSIR